jgi:sugar-specific transcriptional regulator TrmB
MKIKNEDLIEQLKEIGFNEYKAKVFVTLASGRIMSASEIVNEAKIVRGSIYDILKSFVKLGYCNEIETNRILQYQIIDPDIILDKIIKEHTGDYNKSINRLKSTFTNIKEKYSAVSDNESKLINIELIRGYNKHRISKYKELLLTAKKEICGMYRFKGIVSDEADTLSKNFIKRGGEIRSIYQFGLDFKISRNGSTIDATPEELMNICRRFESQGEEIRISRKEIPNMTIIDGESVFINTDDKLIPNQSQADIIMRRTGFAQYMIDLFEHYWENSITINQLEKSKK